MRGICPLLDSRKHLFPVFRSSHVSFDCTATIHLFTSNPLSSGLLLQSLCPSWWRDASVITQLSLGSHPLCCTWRCDIGAEIMQIDVSPLLADFLFIEGAGWRLAGWRREEICPFLATCCLFLPSVARQWRFTPAAAACSVSGSSFLLHSQKQAWHAGRSLAVHLGGLSPHSQALPLSS